MNLTSADTIQIRNRSLRLPSLSARQLVLAIWLVTLVAICFFRATDPDYWWHLKTGELIVKNHAIPTHDAFSYTFAGHAWLDHEWLAQALIYGIVSTVGYVGAVLVFALVGIAALLLSYRLTLRLGVPEPMAMALMLPASLLSISLWSVRPACLSLLLTALFLSAAYEYRHGLRRSLWYLPPLMLLWANLHAGYVFGLGLLGLLCLSQALDAWQDRRELSRLRYTAIIAVLSFLAAGINPYTYRLWLYPFTYFLGDNASMQLISEWRSPALFHSLDGYILGGCVLLLASVGLASRRFDLWRLSLGIVFTALALQSVRHEGLFAIALLPIAGEALHERFPSVYSTRRHVAPLLSLAHLAILAGIALLWLNIVLQQHVQTHRAALTELGNDSYPEAGAALIRSDYPQARIFNQYEWGGYLIDSLYPSQQVFIDGRADLYGRAFLQDYDRVMKLKPGWQQVLEEHGVDLLLIDKNSALAAATRLDPRWQEVLDGPAASVFVLQPPAAPAPSEPSP